MDKNILNYIKKALLLLNKTINKPTNKYDEDQLKLQIGIIFGETKNILPNDYKNVLPTDILNLIDKSDPKINDLQTTPQPQSALPTSQKHHQPISYKQILIKAIEKMSEKDVEFFVQRSNIGVCFYLNQKILSNKEIVNYPVYTDQDCNLIPDYWTYVYDNSQLSFKNDIKVPLSYDLIDTADHANIIFLKETNFITLKRPQK